MLDDIKIKAWLKIHKEQQPSSLLKIFLFGSILSTGKAEDVDVILIFDEWNIREALSELGSNFRARFGLRLHMQIFHISQTEEIDLFIKRASSVEEIL